jgi:hypothetical protein
MSSIACTVCTHEQVGEINELLAEGRPVRWIASQFGLSKDSIHRHSRAHVSRELVAAAEAVDVSRLDSGSLVEQIIELRDVALVLMRSALKAGNHVEARHSMREARATLEVADRMLARAEAMGGGAGAGGEGSSVTLRVVYDNVADITDDEAAVLERLLSRFGLDGSDPDAVAKLDVAIRRLEHAEEAEQYARESEPVPADPEAGHGEPSAHDTAEAERKEPENDTDALTASHDESEYDDDADDDEPEPQPERKPRRVNGPPKELDRIDKMLERDAERGKRDGGITLRVVYDEDEDDAALDAEMRRLEAEDDASEQKPETAASAVESDDVGMARADPSEETQVTRDRGCGDGRGRVG